MAKKKEPEATQLSAPRADSGAPQVVRAKMERAVETSTDYVRLYTNDLQVQLTPWDVRLVLGQIVGTPTKDSPAITIRQIGEVSMSPQFAKKVVAVLMGQIEHYERTVGVIPLPED